IRCGGYHSAIDSLPGCPVMSHFRQYDRATGFLLPPSVDDWLPERHLARFVVEVIDSLDLSAMVKSYRGSGSAGYHPALLLGLLVYGYATGVFSSRKLERATYDSVAFRFIAANDHPTTTPSRRFGDAFSRRLKGCLSGCWNWRARWGCSSLARWRSTAPRYTPMPAGTALSLTSMPPRSKRN